MNTPDDTLSGTANAAGTPSVARPVVAVVGLGAMGSRLAANLLADGYPVVLSARRPSAAETLTAAGGTWASSPGDAARGADVVLVAVTDDEASREVWTAPVTGILDNLAPGSVGIESSTVSVAWIKQLATVAAERGARFLEAPMVGSRPQAEGRALVHLVGGEAALLAQVEPILQVSATRVHHCGTVGSAASGKLIVNALLATQVATLAELLGASRRAGHDPRVTLDLLTSLPVASPALGRAGAAMLAGSPPNFPVDLVAKDLRYLASADPEGRTPMSRAALDVFAAASEAGLGSEDLTAVARPQLPDV